MRSDFSQPYPSVHATEGIGTDNRHPAQPQPLGASVLFIHQNFPGQFRHIAADLAQSPGWRVLAIGRDTAPGMPGVQLIRYRPHRTVRAETHHYLRSYEDGVLHGQAVLRILLDLKAKGYRPDIIVAHPGWGESLFAKEAFPDAKLVHFCEYYYHTKGADADFDPEFPLSVDSAARIRARNALHLLNLEQCDLGITPTHWQHQLHPQAYRDKIVVAHEGIPVEQLGPDPNATLTLPNGTTLRAGQPIVTYVARNLEPHRGFHQFMRALPIILREHASCQVVIVGGDGVSYGSPPADAANWREKLLRENPVDLNRVHFLGKVPYTTYQRVLQVSAAHVYLTYPFVLSWSMLEAMASGCLLIGSRTPPVAEVLTHGRNGLLVDFFGSDEIAESVLDRIDGNQETQSMRQLAKEAAQLFDVRAGIDHYRAALSSVLH
ncbi:glycosyl transferase family 1 [Ralstonia solanacearum]|nr:glycosyl transferase family 1 [Ralstonia solanacearum]AXV90120.1 glycosyl transferase family 1 [Ralstonia solanacearum]AXW18313.1 glycosyl transferase family 1 [Ralstonia solanacearum]AXW75029.1 glycosyl transferase family 1 [Ralstonia solanacearum]BEU71125.1 glycosyltransferase family 4 protein [Ralstonia pseudosolanacearum]